MPWWNTRGKKKKNIQQMFCHTAWLFHGLPSTLLLPFSFCENEPTNIAHAKHCSVKWSLPNDFIRAELDRCLHVRHDTKDCVLHRASTMDTMSPLLLVISGKLKWVVCLGTCHAGDVCHGDERAGRLFPAHLSDILISGDKFIALSHPWTSSNYCGKCW